MIDTPKANRLHIAIFGRRNAGKSSIINAITGQDIALVSNIPGTTTDPVYKAMELLPIGPVMIIDTAGLDDEGEIGYLRIKKTKEVMDKTDLALLIFNPNTLESNISSQDKPTVDYNSCLALEKEWYTDLIQRNIPVIGVINKIDEMDANLETFTKVFNIPFVKVSAKTKLNIGKLKEIIQNNAPMDFEKSTIVGDLIKPKAKVVIVAPQDIQAPKGRLILPQVQIIRDILDNDAMALTVKDSELLDVLASLKEDPDLIITDSQIFKKVNEMVPKHIKLTSFSILMARYKGDLDIFIDGAKAIDDLKPGDKVLICEACTHHALQGDIGRQKLPNWLQEKAKGELDITVTSGSDFPEDLTPYKIILHCGSCMFNRKQLLSRLLRATEQGVPITNYGVAIAHMNGILKRTTEFN